MLNPCSGDYSEGTGTTPIPAVAMAGEQFSHFPVLTWVLLTVETFLKDSGKWKDSHALLWDAVKSLERSGMMLRWSSRWEAHALGQVWEKNLRNFTHMEDEVLEYISKTKI